MARTSRKEINKAKILEVTLKLIAENGFHGTPMSKLAKLADVSVGTIYLYFENKNDLIVELFRIIRSNMAKAILEGYSSELEFEKRYCLLFENVLNYYIEHPYEFKFVEQFHLSPYVKHIFDVFGDEVAKEINDLYISGVRHKILRRMSVDVVTSLVHGPIVSLVKKHQGKFIEITPKMKSELREAIWVSLKS